MFFLQKNDLNIEKIKVKFSQIFLTLISTFKEENKIDLTKMAPGYGIRVNDLLLLLHIKTPQCLILISNKIEQAGLNFEVNCV